MSLHGWLLLVALAGAGCGRPASTLTLEFASHGQAPAGLSSARFTLEEIRVLVAVPGESPHWQRILDDEEGARTFDLLQLGSPKLAAERDVPQGTIQQVVVSFDTDEEHDDDSVLPLDPADTELRFDVSVAEANTVHLVVDFDNQASLVQGPSGVTFRPAAAVRVLP